MIKYYIMAIDLNNSLAMTNLASYYTENKLKLYVLLEKRQKNKIIDEKIKELITDKKIINYIKKQDWIKGWIIWLKKGE